LEASEGIVKTKFTRVTILTIILSSSHSDIAQAYECGRKGWFHLTSAGPWPMSIQTKVGTACDGAFRSGGNTSFKNLVLVSPPQHGSVSLRQGGYYTYRPNAGFQGADSFQMRVCGTEGTIQGCADLHYTATVN
jgi:hypothetical protein